MRIVGVFGVKMVANPKLVKERKISPEDVRMINLLHEECELYLKDMEYFKLESKEFKSSLYEWRMIQARLQLLWGFQVRQDMWKEYNLPHCKCPVMDNDDIGGHYYFSADCPIHGDK
jgi:hypothetical protein